MEKTSIEHFLVQIAKALSNAGLEASADDWSMRVAGCKFVVEKAWDDKEPGSRVMRFEGSNYKVDKHGRFDLERAVGCVIKALPERLAAKKRHDTRMEARANMSELLARRRQAGVADNVSVEFGDLGIRIVVPTHPELIAVLNKLTAERFADVSAVFHFATIEDAEAALDAIQGVSHAGTA